MTVDPSVVPGLLFLLAELTVLAAVGYVIVRVALRETDDRVALAQGLVVGPAIWGIVVNLVMYALPGMAGAVAGWIVVLALTAALTWRAPKPIRPRLRMAAGFALIALALFWIALASRQNHAIHDVDIHIGLAASIRAGVFPPELPWNPGASAPYHYGVYMLNGLLAPPFGPDLAFGEELLGAYAWICLALIVLTAVLRRASVLPVLIIAPLLLTADGILEVVVPAGIPSAGIRASLTEIYWPSADSYSGELPNISRPTFTLSYALAFVVLACAACAGRRSWLSVITLAALIGFLGLTVSTFAPIVFVLWAGLEAIWLVQSHRADSAQRSDVIRSASGLALAAMLLLAGSFSTLILGDSVTSGLSLGGNEYSGGWRLLGALDRLPGGVGIVGLGPLAVAGAAVLLARRNRLVLALAVGTGMLLLASLALNYEPAPWDLKRIEVHARNFALFALLVALAIRLAGLRPARLRYAAVAAVMALVAWPTAVALVYNVGQAIDNGVEVANTTEAVGFKEPHVFERVPSDRITAYIRNNTAVDTRVFSPYPTSMTFATGRPNASGFAGLVHLKPVEGPQYRDVLGYLEPSAIRRLGFEYVHAPDSWVEGLPDEAAEWLNDPTLFELLVHDESESLYRVLPAFLSLDTPSAPSSYEALRRAVPASATVFVSGIFEPRRSLRTARALSYARLLGVIDPAALHLLTPWQTEPLDDRMPDLVIMSAQFVPWTLPPALRQPIWRNDETAVYALDGAIDPITPPSWDEPFPFSVTLSDVHAADGRVVFTATFDDRAPEQWTGQDWVVIARDNSPLGLPTQLLRDGHTAAVHLWFSGQIWPGRGMTSLAYEFDLVAPSMAIRGSGGTLTPTRASAAESGPGLYTLAVRLRHEYKPEHWRDAAIVPVLEMTVSETGEVSYQVYEEAGG